VAGWASWLAILAGSLPAAVAGADQAAEVCLADEDASEPAAPWPGVWLSDDEVLCQEASFFQEQPPRVPPRAGPAGTALPTAGEEFQTDLFGDGLSASRSLLPTERWARPVGVGADVVRRQEGVARNATDGGSLLGSSPSVLGMGVQRRNPIVNDPRIRGSRTGRLSASGSYWVPARMDLDTVISKIDSRIISDVIAVNGPYATAYGPGFSFIEFELMPTPRYEDAFQAEGATSFDYRANGEQWNGRQRFWGGGADWGFRAGYGHRTGNDYTAGNGTSVAASYNSRDVDVALGGDLTANRHIEFHYLRLDQTNVELPGQAFDIDVLYTDGYDVAYVAEDLMYADRVTLDVWYNRTRLDGSAQRPSKRSQFPYYDFIHFVGATDVDSMSTGFRLAGIWGCPDHEHVTAGADLRYVKQQLNEITSGRIGFNLWQDANSPIPRSDLANPGLFVECALPLGDAWTVSGGVRADLASADVLADPASLASLGTESRPSAPISLADILGSDDFSQTFAMWSLYGTGTRRIHDDWTIRLAAGYAERPPSLTELYAAQTFMFVLQNGLNTVTGDPLLKHERLLQADLGLDYERGPFRAHIGGFYGWAWDYITFENMGVVRGPPVGEIEQEQLKFVNTDRATFVGGELLGEYDWGDWLTPFAMLSYTAGTDRTRNGDFATHQASPGSPSTQVGGLPRGAFSGIAGAAQEPLPGIVPLESRLGLRFHSPAPIPRWSVELAARVVDAQRRVARSLLEVPTPGFTVWDLRGYWRVTDNLLTTAGIENLTDRNYREHLNFTSQSGLVQVVQPGLNAYVGAEMNY
jgi:outer membrane receptor protein involved in Fe transport